MNKVFQNKKNEIIGVLLIILGGFVFLSLIPTTNLPYESGLGSISGGSEPFNYNPLAESDNMMGRLGDFFYYHLRYLGFGWSSLIIPVILLASGWMILKKKKLKDFLSRISYLIILMLITSITFGWLTGSNVTASGKFGSNLFVYLKASLGFGVYILMLSTYVLLIKLHFDIPVKKIAKTIIIPFVKVFNIISDYLKSFYQNRRKIESDREKENNVEVKIDDTAEHKDVVNKIEEVQEEILTEEKLVHRNGNNEDLEEVESPLEDLESFSEQVDPDNSEIEITEESLIDEVDLDGLKERKARLFNFKLPSTDLLNDEPNIQTDISEEVLRARGQEIIDALASFGVIGEIVGIKKGPVITLYEIEPAEGVRVNKFTNLSDDLARVMKASRIRVLAPIPGSKCVGIELPNENPKIVYLKNIINSDQYANSESKLTIGLGKTTMGEAFSFDLQKMPHLLVAGATGAGKSVCINTIIVSILYKAKPDEVKFILIDPKKLELATYKSLVGYHLITAPNLDEYVMTTVENAVGILDSAITEMERRFEIFAEARVRNIQEYHEKQKKDSSLEKIPYIIVLIDELADLMMTSGRAVEDPITRLAQKARAVGIHLVVATQRPSVDVITGLIKSNFPARISFQVSSKIDSRTILDQMGAEKLLGRGDMLFLPPGSASPIRVHNAYITLEEIEEIMTHITKQSKPEELLLPERKKEIFDGNFNTDEDRDEFLFDAAKLVVQNQQASVSLLQRKFKIGYSRAGRLVDELEALGVVSGYSGSKARDVLVDESYLDKIFN